MVWFISGVVGGLRAFAAVWGLRFAGGGRIGLLTALNAGTRRGLFGITSGLRGSRVLSPEQVAGLERIARVEGRIFSESAWEGHTQRMVIRNASSTSFYEVEILSNGSAIVRNACSVAPGTTIRASGGMIRGITTTAGGAAATGGGATTAAGTGILGGMGLMGLIMLGGKILKTAINWAFMLIGFAAFMDFIIEETIQLAGFGLFVAKDDDIALASALKNYYATIIIGISFRYLAWLNYNKPAFEAFFSAAMGNYRVYLYKYATLVMAPLIFDLKATSPKGIDVEADITINGTYTYRTTPEDDLVYKPDKPRKFHRIKFRRNGYKDVDKIIEIREYKEVEDMLSRLFDDVFLFNLDYDLVYGSLQRSEYLPENLRTLVLTTPYETDGDIESIRDDVEEELKNNGINPDRGRVNTYLHRLMLLAQADKRAGVSTHLTEDTINEETGKLFVWLPKTGGRYGAPVGSVHPNAHANPGYLTWLKGLLEGNARKTTTLEKEGVTLALYDWGYDFFFGTAPRLYKTRSNVCAKRPEMIERLDLEVIEEWEVRAGVDTYAFQILPDRKARFVRRKRLDELPTVDDIYLTMACFQNEEREYRDVTTDILASRAPDEAISWIKTDPETSNDIRVYVTMDYAPWERYADEYVDVLFDLECYNRLTALKPNGEPRMLYYEIDGERVVPDGFIGDKPVFKMKYGEHWVYILNDQNKLYKRQFTVYKDTLKDPVCDMHTFRANLCSLDPPIELPIMCVDPEWATITFQDTDRTEESYSFINRQEIEIPHGRDYDVIVEAEGYETVIRTIKNYNGVLPYVKCIKLKPLYKHESCKCREEECVCDKNEE